MPDKLELAVVVAFVAVAVVFLAFIQSGGFLEIAIERAIEDGRVILGMTQDDVISSWGRAYTANEITIEPMGVDEALASSWTYEHRHCTVHFSHDGIVILVTCNHDG